MKTASNIDFFSSLFELGNVYPEMRFGQLVVMASTLASEELPEDIEESQDTAVARAAHEHAAERAAQKGCDPFAASGASDYRTGLFRQLEELHQLYDDWSIGRLIGNIVGVAGLNLYHAADQELLRACIAYPPKYRGRITWEYSPGFRPSVEITDAVMRSTDELVLDFRYNADSGECRYSVPLRRVQGNQFQSFFDVPKSAQIEHCAASCVLENKDDEIVLRGDSWKESTWDVPWSATLKPANGSIL
jgi:hypothetical protein